MNNQQEKPYGFAAEPRSVALRTKYRPNGELTGEEYEIRLSLMSDPRVCRGSNFAPTKDVAGIPGASVTAPPVLDAGTTRKRKTKIRKKQSTIYDIRPELRKHIEVPLDEHLIEQTKPVSEAVVFTQTDRFKPLPPPKPYVPRKTGVDAFTQIEEADNLFDFNLEVEPLLAVLVGKTQEQALVEVEEERELLAIRQARADFVSDEGKETVAVAELERLETVKWAEKEKVRVAAKEALEAKRVLTLKVAARSFGAQMARGVMEDSLRRLASSGAFYNPRRVEVARDFMPYLYGLVEAETTRVAAARAALDDIVSASLARQREAQLARQLVFYPPAPPEEVVEVVPVKPATPIPEGFIRVFLPPGSFGQEQMVGPIPVSPNDPVAEVEKTVMTWLSTNVPGFTPPESGLLHLGLEGHELDQERTLMEMDIVDNTTLDIA